MVSGGAPNRRPFGVPNLTPLAVDTGQLLAFGPCSRGGDRTERVLVPSPAGDYCTVVGADHVRSRIGLQVTWLAIGEG